MKFLRKLFAFWFLTAFVPKDKWGKDEAPIVDWDEVKEAWALDRCKWWHLRELVHTDCPPETCGAQAFSMWKNFKPYNPFQYLGGFAAVMKEA